MIHICENENPKIESLGEALTSFGIDYTVYLNFGDFVLRPDSENGSWKPKVTISNSDIVVIDSQMPERNGGQIDLNAGGIILSTIVKNKIYCQCIWNSINPIPDIELPDDFPTVLQGRTSTDTFALVKKTILSAMEN